MAPSKMDPPGQRERIGTVSKLLGAEQALRALNGTAQQDTSSSAESTRSPALGLLRLRDDLQRGPPGKNGAPPSLSNASDSAVRSVVADQTPSLKPSVSNASIITFDVYESLQRELEAARERLRVVDEETRQLREIVTQKDQPNAVDDHDDTKECPKCAEYEPYAARLEDELLSLRKRVADQAAQLDLQRDEMERLRQSSPMPDQVLVPRVEWGRLYDESVAHKAKSLSLVTTVQSLETEIQRLAERNRILEEEVVALREARALEPPNSPRTRQRQLSVHAVEARMSQLEQEIEMERQDKVNMQRDLGIAREIVADLESQLASQQSSAVMLQRQLYGLAEENRLLKEKQNDSQLDSENANLRAQLQRSQSRLRVLQSTVDQVLHSPTIGASAPRLAWAATTPSAASPVAQSATPRAHSAKPGEYFRPTSMLEGSSGNLLRADSSASFRFDRAEFESDREPIQEGANAYGHEWSRRSSGNQDQVKDIYEPGYPQPSSVPIQGSTPASGQFDRDAQWQEYLELARNLESHLKDLQKRKEGLQSEYSRIPLHTAQSRRRKEELEGALDAVEGEMASVRRRLKAMNFL